MGTEIGRLVDVWPVIEFSTLIFLTVIGFTIKQSLKKIEFLAEALTQLTNSLNKLTTSLAVVTSELEAHSRLDTERFAAMEVRMNETRSAVETAARAAVSASTKADIAHDTAARLAAEDRERRYGSRD